MVTPLQNKKTGKFEGSIGTGKTRIPAQRRQPKLVKNIKIRSTTDIVNFFHLIHEKEAAVNNAAQIALFAARRERDVTAEKAARLAQGKKLAAVHQELLAKQGENLGPHPLYGGQRWGYSFVGTDRYYTGEVKDAGFIVNYGAGEELETIDGKIVVGYNKIPLADGETLWFGRGSSNNVVAAAWKNRDKITKALIERGIQPSGNPKDISILNFSIKDKILTGDVYNQNIENVEAIKIPLDFA